MIEKTTLCRLKKDNYTNTFPVYINFGKISNGKYLLINTENQPITEIYAERQEIVPLTVLYLQVSNEQLDSVLTNIKLNPQVIEHAPSTIWDKAYMQYICHNDIIANIKCSKNKNLFFQISDFKRIFKFDENKKHIELYQLEIENLLFDKQEIIQTKIYQKLWKNL